MLRVRVLWPSNTYTQNWKPIGVVGYNVDAVDKKNSTDGWWSNIWELFVIQDGSLSDPHNTSNNIKESLGGKTGDIQAAITNVHPTKSLQVKLRVRVLCVRTDI